MRKILFAVSAVAALAVPGAASAQYYYEAADVYAPPPAVYGVPRVVTQPPVVAAPMVESQVYLAPGAVTVAPGVAYQDQPIYMNGQRYYRDCWWDWGRRVCELKRWW